MILSFAITFYFTESILDSHTS